MQNDNITGAQFAGSSSFSDLRDQRQSNRLRMAMGYLYLNSLLYLGFAVWCTASPVATAVNLGFLSVSNGGWSEYLVIYGGLQVGLALLFYLLARNPTTIKFGVLVALALYSPVVIYRGVTVALNWPVGGLTLATAGIECFLLLCAIAAYRGLQST